MVIDQWDTLPAYSYNFTATVVHIVEIEMKEKTCVGKKKKGPITVRMYDEHGDDGDASSLRIKDS